MLREFFEHNTDCKAYFWRGVRYSSHINVIYIYYRDAFSIKGIEFSISRIRIKIDEHNMWQSY
jgi:hypothetical protein